MLRERHQVDLPVDPGRPAVIVHQVEEGVVAAQRLGGRLEHARHGGLHGAGVQHGLADGPVRRADHDVLQRAGRVLQEVQDVGQLARQLVWVALRHVTLDRHHADGPRAGSQRDHQPRLVRGAAQGVGAVMEGLRLDAGRIVEVDRDGRGSRIRWGINPLQPPLGRQGAIDAHIGQPKAQPQRQAPLPKINEGVPPPPSSGGTRRAVSADAPDAVGGGTFFADTRTQGDGPSTGGKGGAPTRKAGWPPWSMRQK